MYRTVLAGSLALFSIMLPVGRATIIPRLTFEQLTDASEVIASGEVTQCWTAWDSEHKYIWTHYRLRVADTAKGTKVSSVEFAEPGGAITGGVSMMIPGTVTYGVGDRVAIFLARMPNGYLRTAGWAQGKYTLDEKGVLRSHAAIGADFIEPRNFIDAKNGRPGVSLQTLDGMNFSELKQRVAVRTRTAQ
jgi:hypothetical protein